MMDLNRKKWENNISMANILYMQVEILSSRLLLRLIHTLYGINKNNFSIEKKKKYNFYRTTKCFFNFLFSFRNFCFGIFFLFRFFCKTKPFVTIFMTMKYLFCIYQLKIIRDRNSLLMDQILFIMAWQLCNRQKEV